MATPLKIKPPQLFDSPGYVCTGARISADGKYRYRLWREWRAATDVGHDPKHWRWLGGNDGAGRPLGEPLAVLFVMLNPSTADGETDDPTIRRCVSFCRAWRYERLEVVNLFAYRATKPADLRAFKASGGDLIGWENSTIIGDACRDAGLVVCAWGAHGDLGDNNDHVETVRGWMCDKKHYALGFTKSGQPRHPLYVRRLAKLVSMPE